ncbi:MAG: hypothetical protein Q9195_006124 [Heterodermia aff. obscurata]
MEETDELSHSRRSAKVHPDTGKSENPGSYHSTQRLISSLQSLANETPGTEFSTLARQVASRLQADKIKRGSVFHQLLTSVRQSLDGGQRELDMQIKYTLHGHIANKKIGQVSVEDQAQLADLRYPLEWYPGTRALQRTIHLHVGPTNSGKTYHALKRLEQAKTGVYAGPLRLLAHEVYTRLNAQGKKCHLITGDDMRINEDASDDTESMISCTVEMVPVNAMVDVGVIDEIQMIGHPERGWAWSQAFLGLKAKELHLCGEARTAPLIRELAAAMGDELVLHHYERLSPLKMDARSLKGNLKHLRKGDCLVAFSRKEIHALKNNIESMTGKQAAIIYGSLPPETRAHQASLFNDPDNEYDYLVATDAIGMGLNLDIKRIVFESSYKFNGAKFIPIPIPHLKQIAGRAGRYRIAPLAKPPSDSLRSMGNNTGDGPSTVSASIPSERPSSTSVGLVTTLEQMDFSRVHKAMNTEAEPLMAAGIYPPSSVLVKFAAYFPPSTPFSYILQRLHEISSLDPRYFLCDLKDQTWIADIIEPVNDLTIENRIVFCASPVGVRSPGFNAIVLSFAQCVANSKEVSSDILDIPTLPLEILDQEIAMERGYLVNLELLHKALILYLWLSYRFTGVFTTRPMAIYLKEIVEEKINKLLEKSSSNRKRKLKSLRELAKLEELGQTIGTGEEAPKPKVEPANEAFGKGFRFDLSFGGTDAVNPAETPDEESSLELEENDFGIDSVPDLQPGLDWQQNPQAVEHEQRVNAGTESSIGNPS